MTIASFHPQMFTFCAGNHLMTEEEFSGLVRRLKSGDNSALAALNSYQADCVRMLVSKSSYRCSADMAYDIFADSVFDFRVNVLRDKVVYQNMKAYLKRICWNKYLAMMRTQQRQEREVYGITTHLYESSERVTAMEETYTERLKALDRAMGQMSEQCRKVLYLAIGDELSMAGIAEQLHLSSADVAKTTKSRCLKRLMALINQIPPK
jgi:RNA polymerase sigma factor (sigma-70 family)